MKVQNYSVEEIAEKELCFLIPLTCIRYYSKKDRKVRKNIELSLTQFLEQCMIIISDAIKKGKLTGRSGKDVLDCFQRGCHYLFVEDEETRQEVQQMLEPYFKLEREIWQEEITEQITEQSIKKLIRSLKNCGIIPENIKKQIVVEYELSEEEAEKKLELYLDKD